jgi:LuxR family transcriptional regulator, maltose regulon positive regulatory protein
MDVSVLSTKIRIPPARPHSIARPRLLACLRKGAGYDLVLVSAPAGFGKTTLLSQWAGDGRAGTTCWLSLDDGDNDLARFWTHFIAALTPLGPEVGREALALLHSGAPFPPESFLIALANGLGRISARSALVLDDYHVIESPAVHAGITFLLDHTPTGMQLVIAGRADPPLPLARYRGRGTMLEIGADDLRFTLEEASSLLGELVEVQPTSLDVAVLNKRTEGWAVGLKLAALSMGESEDVSGFLHHFAGSQRFVMDYLMEEVLQNQPDEVQHFLLETSLLDTFTASLCDAVTGRTDGDGMLRTLKIANLFVVPLDDSGACYRYEHLFGDVLRHQLGRSTSREGITALHRRAARWYEEHGLPRAAVDHSLAAHDWDKAMDLLAVESLRLEQTGEMVTFLRWTELLPKDVLRGRPRLQLSQAIAFLFSHQTGAAEEVLTDLEKDGGLDDVTRGRALACRAFIAAGRGDADEAMGAAQAALQLLPREDLGFRSSLSLNLGGMYFFEKARFGEGEALLRQAYDLGRREKHQWITVQAAGALSLVAFLRGRLSEAIEQTERAMVFAGDSPAAAFPHGYLASLVYERNDLELALSHLEKSVELGRLLAVSPQDWETSNYVRMEIQLARGDLAAAGQALEQIDRWAAKDSSPAANARRACSHLVLALRRRDEEEAVRWGRAVADCEGPVFYKGRYLLVPLLLLQGRVEQVDDEIRAFYESIGVEYLSAEWPYWRILARIHQALAAPGWAEAREYLAEALALAAPERYFRTFADEGSALVPLLRKAVAEGIEPRFAAALVTIIEAEKRLTGAGDSARVARSRGILTDRELEVLRLAAAGMSNREIAEKLFVSSGTVKVHLYNICEKLNTSGRARAVLQARELHFI